MTTKLTQPALRELIRTFDCLRGLHQQLLGVLEAKIAAMRAADVAGLEVANKEEHAILPLLREKDQLRAGLMQAMAREYGLTAKAARTATVSQLAGFVPAVERELLLGSSARLQEVLARSSQANRLAASIAKQVTNHMKFVFSALRPACTAPIGYTLRGESFAAGPAIVDVVG